MYVCICNAIRKQEVESIIAEGVTDVADVYEALDVEPQCGTCEAFIRELMTDQSADSEPEIAA